jgi:chloramphenicol 3-O phosphotransferase
VILFLNGASSAGKSTLGRALQESLRDPFLLLGLDTLFATVPGRWAGGPAGPMSQHGFHYAELPPDDEGRPVLTVRYGEVGWQMLSGWHRAVAELARAGNNLIVDEMLLDDRVRDHWLAVLAPHDPVLVGVHCDLDELDRRERNRGHRPGLSRWSARQAHRGVPYTVTVDTTATEPARAAAQVIAALGLRPERVETGVTPRHADGTRG